jgi:hypothetical protein
MYDRAIVSALDRARFGADAKVFYHDGATAEGGLSGLRDAEKKALLAFLDLL